MTTATTTAQKNNAIDGIIRAFVIALNNKSQLGHMGMGYGNKVYSVNNGRKYAKVVCTDTYNGRESRSVFCFIDRNTGDVYKPATWKAPAKGVRYTIDTLTSARELAEVSDGHGRFLYLR